MPEESEGSKQLELMHRLVDLAEQQTELSTERTRMSSDRSRMSAERSQMSAERSYMNAERTLSVWIRTALALMVLGIAIDRFGLFLRQMQLREHHGSPASDLLTTWGGGALVALGVAMVISYGIRFLSYAAAYRRSFQLPPRHGPSLSSAFTVLVALFGIAVLVVMIVFSEHA